MGELMPAATEPATTFTRRNLIVLSDGTGNSGAKLFKTNVWRIYDALDLNCDDQVALYDDGVGTASFKPVAILGGAFGYGLKRNVLELYTFLCRNYRATDDYHYDPHNPSADEPAKHDAIFAFGFSRGAFTARVVASLVAHEGLIQRAETDAELKRLATWAYRSYRAKRYGHHVVVRMLRQLRDRILRVLEWKKPAYNPTKNRNVPIDFLGVFDTVAAYGLPVDELTRGWDRWIWPMTPRDHSLNERVRFARHAVAIDDERQTFFPLLWDEDSDREKQKNKAFRHPDNRIKQVWFAGMHSNVGGGYADDALSLGPLCWMAGEAAEHGLRFQRGLRPSKGPIPEMWVERAAPCAPMGDSRHGAGAYYRYHPRPLARLCGFKDHSTEPNPMSPVRIDVPKIHVSVFERIRDSRDNYAPFALPERYAIVTRSGQVLAGDVDGRPEPAGPNPFEHSTQAASRVREQQRAWDAVWMRRVVYFATVAATLSFLALPLLPFERTTADSSHTLALVVGVAGGFLPGFAQSWVEAYREIPGWFTLMACVVGGLLWLGSHLKGYVNDRMVEVWGTRAGLRAARLDTPAPEPTGRIYRLRESAGYKALFRFMSDTLWPNVFGLTMALLIVGVLPLRLTYQVVSRLDSFGRSNGGFSEVRVVPHETPEGPGGGVEGGARAIAARETWFYPDEISRETGIVIERDVRYAIQVAIPVQPITIARATSQAAGQAEQCPGPAVRPGEERWLGGWKDASIPVPSSAGIKGTWAMNLFVPFRRVWSLDWFVPVAAIGRKVPERHYLTVPTTEFTATRTGRLTLYVNDAAFPVNAMGGLCLGWDCYYQNNSGGPARVRVTQLNANMSAASLPQLDPYSCEQQVSMLADRRRGQP